MLPARDSTAVFLNVPFDPAYQPYFVTLVGTLVSLGQTPRCVLEIPETGAGRLTRIFELLSSCRASIHDLCRVGVPARFNMPFELGVACALALQGEPHEIVVLDRQRYRLDRTLSDYKGRDPLIYSSLDTLVDAVADVFQVADEPSPEVLKAEARVLRRSARAIAASPGTLFRRTAFRTLVAAATRRARSRGLISE
jgi:hypothetical protein